MTANSSTQVRRVAVTVRMGLTLFLRGKHGKHASYERVTRGRNSTHERHPGSANTF